jgi:hypothetical protein
MRKYKQFHQTGDLRTLSATATAAALSIKSEAATIAQPQSKGKQIVVSRPSVVLLAGTGPPGRPQTSQRDGPISRSTTLRFSPVWNIVPIMNFPWYGRGRKLLVE